METNGTTLDGTALRGTIDEVLRNLAHTIEAEGNAKTIFGAAVKLDNHTVVPVATLEIAFGGGLGVGSGPRFIQTAIDLAKKIVPGGWGAGGGGGMSIRIRPVGFIREDQAGATFVSIPVPPSEPRHR